MNILSNILALLVVIGVIIFVHELGHYLAARAFRIRVRVFSIGFGPRIWGFERGDTEYRLAMVPLGGYVAFSGIDPSNPTGDAGDFITKPRWQRIVVLLAGPAANVVLSIVLIAAVLVAGTELAGPRDLSTEIGAVAPESAASEAGLQAGDTILRLDEEDVSDWRDVANIVLVSPERRLAVDFERDGRTLSTVLVPRRIPRHELGDAGMYASLLPRVREVFEGTPAERAGIRYGDTLYAVDGHPIADADDFRRLVEPKAGEEVSLEIGRADERLIVRFVPADEGGVGRAGIAISHFSYQRVAPGAALIESARINWETTTEIFGFLGRLVERRASPQSGIAGPIEIARISGQAARRSFNDLVFLTALISLNICILNLLPIPLLDGGQLAILLFESVLRRDLSVRIKNLVTQFGLVVIVSIMMFALYSDLVKNLPGLGR
ncbi:MAG: site-2 protease family protein [Acidobacteria bacterium]|nr:site-2 protease family protein [Acidobacteriota bacterium]